MFSRLTAAGFVIGDSPVTPVLFQQERDRKATGKGKMSDYSFIVVVFIVLGLIAAAFFVSSRKSKRAVVEVVAIFQKHNAIGTEQAKTASELGLTSPSLVDSFTRMRDYKPDALNTLMRMNIVQSTEDGKLYLPADILAELRSRGIGK